MGKNGGFLTPKAISNRIKAKGLQKLRWYCQACQKQCRDEVIYKNIYRNKQFYSLVSSVTNMNQTFFFLNERKFFYNGFYFHFKVQRSISNWNSMINEGPLKYIFHLLF